MKRIIFSVGLSVIAAASTVQPAKTHQTAPLSRVPFTATLSNTTPLVFGMAADDAARALGVPLTYVNGRPGNEIYLALRDIGGSGFFDRRDRLYLQFRKGRLTGWKGDWGRNWMWQ
jgi:hypothetical protein